MIIVDQDQRPPRYPHAWIWWIPLIAAGILLNSCFVTVLQGSNDLTRMLVVWGVTIFSLCIAFYVSTRFLPPHEHDNAFIMPVMFLGSAIIQSLAVCKLQPDNDIAVAGFFLLFALIVAMILESHCWYRRMVYAPF